jgi:hypothetical protein
VSVFECAESVDKNGYNEHEYNKHNAHRWQIDQRNDRHHEVCYPERHERWLQFQQYRVLQNIRFVLFLYHLLKLCWQIVALVHHPLTVETLNIVFPQVPPGDIRELNSSR